MDACCLGESSILSHCWLAILYDHITICLSILNCYKLLVIMSNVKNIPVQSFFCFVGIYLYLSSRQTPRHGKAESSSRYILTFLETAFQNVWTIYIPARNGWEFRSPHPFPDDKGRTLSFGVFNLSRSNAYTVVSAEDSHWHFPNDYWCGAPVHRPHLHILIC